MGEESSFNNKLIEELTADKSAGTAEGFNNRERAGNEMLNEEYEDLDKRLELIKIEGSNVLTGFQVILKGVAMFQRAIERITGGYQYENDAGNDT